MVRMQGNGSSTTYSRLGSSTAAAEYCFTPMLCKLLDVYLLMSNNGQWICCPYPDTKSALSGALGVIRQNGRSYAASLVGRGQESGRRSGTENVAGAASMAAALLAQD
ncbi:MAG: hypothetical protein R3C68_17985 [Myxococcota bacterium]